MNKTCLICSSEFYVPKSRELTAKYCSRKCSDSAPRKKNLVNCAECGSVFPLKKSQQDRNKYWGSFCSSLCSTTFRKRATLGEGNPNYKNRNYDCDGYRTYTPHASLNLGFGKIKVHHAVCFSHLGIKSVPDGYHVHHKDCDVLNNDASNLQLISNSDHKWIHKQYGSATLWAFEKGKIDIDDISSWSSDKARAKFLLLSNLTNQSKMLSNLNPENIKDVNLAITMNKGYFNEN